MSSSGFRAAAMSALWIVSASAAGAETPQAPSQAQMKATLRTYFEAMNAGDIARLKSLCSSDAMIEDPIGTPLVTSDQFFNRVAPMKLKFDIVMMTASNTNVAATGLNLKVGARTLDAIEIFTFKPDGKIASMKAYWGSGDFR
jgi:steroid delta-isomerase